jgi:MFS family permease
MWPFGKSEKSHKTVRTFGIASFLNDLGADMINPIWTLFLTNVLGANMAIVGLIDGVGEALVSISQAVSGHFSDKLKKRKVFIWMGYLFGAVSRIGYAFSHAWPAALGFKVMDRMGKMRDAPRDAMVSDVSSFWNRGAHFGVIRSMDNLGGVCGVLTCMLLITLLPVRTIFWMAAIPSFIAALLMLFFIHEEKPSEKIFEGLHFKNLSTSFRLTVLLSGIFALGNFSYSFLLIFTQKLDLQLVFVPIFYLIFMALSTVSSYPFGVLSDHIGRKAVLQISFLLWALTLVLFITAKNFLFIVLAFVCYGLFKGAIDTVQRTFVSELAPANLKASALGAFKMVVGLCALPSSLMAGFLWDRYGPLIPLAFSLVLTTISALLLMVVQETEQVKLPNP